jgi:dTDP-4-dehydrorhamnose 3,5-epimerase
MTVLIRDNSIVELPLKDALLIQPKEFQDERGVFFKLYTSKLLSEKGIRFDIAEDYLTYSKKGVLRGLHYQTDPFPQAKLVTCLRGKIFDAIVDMRKDSLTFGRSCSVVLEGGRPDTLYVPRGFAHGNLAMERDTIVTYKADNPHSPEHEHGLLWSDPDLRIAWPKIGKMLVSDKDSRLPLLRDYPG